MPLPLPLPGIGLRLPVFLPHPLVHQPLRPRYDIDTPYTLKIPEH